MQTCTVDLKKPPSRGSRIGTGIFQALFWGHQLAQDIEHAGPLDGDDLQKFAERYDPLSQWKAR